MSKKSKEIQLQSELETTEEFEEMLGREGLTVVDVYQEWCGPCKSIISNFRKLKNELGDDMLKFSTAKADTIDWLAEYRGKCEPCFLFFATGCLVSVVRGANAPMLMKTITDQLKQEHRVLEGLTERKEIVDLRHKDPESEIKEEVSSETTTTTRQERGPNVYSLNGEIVTLEGVPELATSEAKKREITIAIIKPDAVKAGHVDDIISEMKDMGIEILEKQERNLSEEEAREFYSHVEGEEFYEDLITFMTSGHCILLVLSKGNTGEGIINEWKSLLGPKSVEEAKESMPDSLRAKYGKETFFNALHGSDTHETASRELGFFFPRYVVPKAVTEKPEVQRTLALIRPELLLSKKDEILDKIKEAGFVVAMQKTLNLNREQIEFFYSEHKGQPYFDNLVSNMCKGPIMALALARDDAVKGWRDILGPKNVDAEKEKESLRATYQIKESEVLNQIHGSATIDEAKSEIEYFFPKEQTLAVIKPDGYENRDQIIDKIKEAGFHIAARKHVSLSTDIAQEFYKDLKNEDCFDELTNHMTSGKTLCMVLTKQDAIAGWRNMIGPKNPDDAKSDIPTSIRSLYGTDTIANAVHGSSDDTDVKNNIKLIFGESAIEGVYQKEDQPDNSATSVEYTDFGSSTVSSTTYSQPINDDDRIHKSRITSDTASKNTSTTSKIAESHSLRSRRDSDIDSQATLRSRPSIQGSSTSLQGSRQSVHRSRPSLQRSQKSVHESKSGQGSKQSIQESKQSIHESKQSLKGSKQSIQESKQSIQESKQSTQGSKQSIKGSKQSIQESKQSIQESKQSTQGSKQSIKGSKQSLQESKQSIKGSKQSTQGSKQSIQDSKQSIQESKSGQGSKQSIQDSKQSIQESKQSIQESKQSIQESKQSLQESKQSLQESKQSIKGSKQSIQDSKQSLHESKSGQGSKQSIHESKQSIQGSKQSVQGSKQSVQGSKQSVQGSKQSVQESKQSIQESKQSIQESKQSIQESKQSLQGSKQSIQESKQSLQGSKQSIQESKQSLQGSKQSLQIDSKKSSSHRRRRNSEVASYVSDTSKRSSRRSSEVNKGLDDRLKNRIFDSDEINSATNSIAISKTSTGVSKVGDTGSKISLTRSKGSDSGSKVTVLENKSNSKLNSSSTLLLNKKDQQGQEDISKSILSRQTRNSSLQGSSVRSVQRSETSIQPSMTSLQRSAKSYSPHSNSNNSNNNNELKSSDEDAAASTDDQSKDPTSADNQSKEPGAERGDASDKQSEQTDPAKVDEVGDNTDGPSEQVDGQDATEQSAEPEGKDDIDGDKLSSKEQEEITKSQDGEEPKSEVVAENNEEVVTVKKEEAENEVEAVDSKETEESPKAEDDKPKEEATTEE